MLFEENTKKRIILASRSPRRQALLKQIGLSFDVIESTVEEQFDFLKTPQENVLALSFQKAFDVAQRVNNSIIIGADTVVVLDGEILGKPMDRNNAVEMLTRLSGKTHEVYTGYTILDVPSNFSQCDFEKTKVTFRTLTREEIELYVNAGSPMDKAGGYGIQDDYGAVFVTRIEGCFYNVVGFPLTKFYISIKEFLRKLNSRK